MQSRPRERGIGQLEANLVVSLAGTPVRERISSDLTRDFDLPARNERAPHRGAEEVLPTVDSASAEGGPHELFHEFLAQIFDVALVGTRCDRFRPHSLQLIALADIRGDADDASAIALFKPGNDDGCI